MKIKVMSREVFENFTSDESYIVISITDPNSEPVESNKEYLAMLSLQFHDVDAKTKREDCKECHGTGIRDEFAYINGGYCYSCTDKMDVTFFNKKDAEQILDFVEAFKNITDMVVIHCEAGISRSAGVAGALAYIYNDGNDDYFFQHYLPNFFVYNTILKVHMKDMDE